MTTDELPEIVRYAAATGQPDYACWIAEALADYFTNKGLYQECRAALEAALSHADQAGDSRMAASLRTCIAYTYCVQGHSGQALPWIAKALTHADWIGDLRERGRALGALGIHELAAGQAEAADRLFAEVLAIGREVDDDWLSGMAPFYRGVIQHGHGHHAQALEYLKQSLVMAEKIGRPHPMCRTLSYLGAVLLDLDRVAQAAEVLRRAMDIAEEADDVPLRAQSLIRLGTARLRLGDTAAAFALQQRALAAVTEQTGPDLMREIRERLAESPAIENR